MITTKEETKAFYPLIFILPEKTKSEPLYEILKQAGEFAYPQMNIKAETITKVENNGSKKVTMRFTIIFSKTVPIGAQPPKETWFLKFAKLLRLHREHSLPFSSVPTFQLLLRGDGLTPGEMNNQLTFSFSILTGGPGLWTEIHDDIEEKHSPHAHLLSSYHTFINKARSLLMAQP